MGYDAALVSLELASLHVREGHTREVRALAHEMTPIFQAQGIHREALAALRLFCRAAEQEEVTVEMTQRMTEYLSRARHNPDLSFEPSGSR
jgi:hypothetical protein